MRPYHETTLSHPPGGLSLNVQLKHFSKRRWSAAGLTNELRLVTSKAVRKATTHVEPVSWHAVLRVPNPLHILLSTSEAVYGRPLRALCLLQIPKPRRADAAASLRDFNPDLDVISRHAPPFSPRQLRRTAVPDGCPTIWKACQRVPKLRNARTSPPPLRSDRASTMK